MMCRQASLGVINDNEQATHVGLDARQPLRWRPTGGAVTHVGTSDVPAAPTLDLLARAFNAAPNGFVLVDAAGRIVAANAELHRMFGYELDTFIGKTVEMLLPEALRNMPIGLRTGFFEHPEPRLMGCRARAVRTSHRRPRVPRRNRPKRVGRPAWPARDVGRRHQRARGPGIGLPRPVRGLALRLLIVDDKGNIAMANRIVAAVLGHTPTSLEQQPLHTLIPERYRGGHGALMGSYRNTRLNLARLTLSRGPHRRATRQQGRQDDAD